MDIVTGAMSALLPKLAELLKEEFNLQTSLRDDIAFLVAELESIQVALLKVSEAPMDQPPDIQVKHWAKEVRELSYDIEDRVDTFTVRVDAPRNKLLQPDGLKALVHGSVDLLKKAEIRHNIGADIKDIKRRIKEVNERRERYKVDSSVSAKHTGPSVDSLRLSALYRKAAELIGTEEKSNYLVNKLMMNGDDDAAAASNKQHQLKIVSIVGFGGLGKTTLAKLVYEKLKVHFECGAFVSVSLNPNMISLFKNMLYQLGSYNNVATWGEVQLIDELRQYLQNKRYFIVIDDIWSESAWKRIQYALIENECGSRIITTTRILDVAKSAGGVYELQPLTPADSRKLFNIRIFGTEETSLPKELEEVYNGILKKCGGVPLAIITIASMLATGNKERRENTYKYWSKVYRTMGSGLEDSPDINEMRKILLMSYYELPPHLKTCMLYLSLFPEDSEVNTEYLIWQWVGEGFVLKEHGKTIYEVGLDYVHQLINRSMIEPADFDTDRNEVTYCRIHDMVLDLVTCLSNEDGFQTIVDGQRTVCLPNRIRRLTLQSSNEEDVKQVSAMNLSQVRSLTVFKGSFNFLPPLSIFPVLRVLDLNGCRQVCNNHFKDICNLLHLRFLGLWLTSITKVPEEIGNLQFLQVLDISCNKVDEVPITFLQLRQLVCLRFDHLKRIPDGFGCLKSLEQLEGRIDVESPSMLYDLGRLTQLRRMGLSFTAWDNASYESNKKYFFQFLSKLVCLEHLKMDGFNGDFDSQQNRLSPRPHQLRDIRMMGCIIPAVPRWMSSLSELSVLSMRLVTLGEEDLRVLGSIPCLSHLEISVKEPTQGRNKRLVISKVYPFLCLTKFKIYGMMEVVFVEGAIQRLRALVLSFQVRQSMEQFGEFNFGLENLSSLAHVDVDMARDEKDRKSTETAEAAIRQAVNMNPNKPTVKFGKL